MHTLELARALVPTPEEAKAVKEGKAKGSCHLLQHCGHLASPLDVALTSEQVAVRNRWLRRENAATIAVYQRLIALMLDLQQEDPVALRAAPTSTAGTAGTGTAAAPLSAPAPAKQSAAPPSTDAKTAAAAGSGRPGPPQKTYHWRYRCR